jgi:acyl carrier protein
VEKLLEILKSLHPEVDYMSCENLIDNKIIDSFDIITIITEISNEFDVAVPPEEIIPANFNSAQALQMMIERLQDDDLE